MMTDYTEGVIEVGDGSATLGDLMDPSTGKTRVRMVEVDTDTFRSALALQRRVTAEDLSDDGKLAAIAEAAGLSPADARERYAPLA